MRRWVLSKKDTKLFIRKLAQAYRGYSPEYNKVEIVITDNIKVYLIDSIPAFIELREDLVPHLMYLLKKGYNWLPALVVDEGAVQPISKGADLMRPGIVEVLGSFMASDIVVILEPTRRLPIAVHKAIIDSEELASMEKGRVTKRLHYVGDRYWRMFFH